MSHGANARASLVLAVWTHATTYARARLPGAVCARTCVPGLVAGNASGE
eukprot:CAMPEP_0185184386 /NCGR_PEP_ID=MMETSP1140-20130426/2550_1 /TAXON_ID=298111 /ORGANISM="Pavlova sp., Strain CCMP459" /LENGTH=48 /DNA_ID= /DNA_START= /DNA_END= /DNA_ORIENTATION=